MTSESIRAIAIGALAVALTLGAAGIIPDRASADAESRDPIILIATVTPAVAAFDMPSPIALPPPAPAQIAPAAAPAPVAPDLVSFDVQPVLAAPAPAQTAEQPAQPEQIAPAPIVSDQIEQPAPAAPEAPDAEQLSRDYQQRRLDAINAGTAYRPRTR